MNWDRFFNFQTNSVTRAAGLLAGSTLISKILALVRDGLLAGRFGAGAKTDIYFAAFRIPDLVYNFLIAGGLVVAFLPLFSEYYSKNKPQAWKITNYILNAFLILLVIICGLLFIFTPSLIDLIAPGFSPHQQDLAIALTRLMFLSPIFFGLSSIFSGILHYFNRFLIYGLAPVLYNLGIIFGILVLAPWVSQFNIEEIFGVGIGVVIGAFCHWIIQIPSARRCGFRYRFLVSFRKPPIKRAFKLMLPRSFAMASQQINLIVITAIASTIAAGSIAVFNFANNLRRVPIGLIGIPFSIASFPLLSKAWAQGKKKKFLNSFSKTFRGILFLVVPASVLVFILRAHLVRLILGSLGKQFGWKDTILTAASLGLFCIGIFSSALIAFVSRAFFSLKDTKTPTVITLVGISLNIILSFSLVWALGFPNFLQNFLRTTLKLKSIPNISVIGLPLAFSLAISFQFFLLSFFFLRRIKYLGLSYSKLLREVGESAKKIVLASLAMVISTYLTLYLVANLVNTRTVLGLAAQAALAGLVGGAVFLGISFLLQSPELKIIKSLELDQTFWKDN